jgi:ribosomal-protein-serine acetyltransferase
MGMEAVAGATITVGERLRLEPLGEQHIAAGSALIDRSRAALLPWMPWAAASDEAAYEAFVMRTLRDRRAAATPAAGCTYAIVVDGAFAGCIDLHDEIPADRSAAIGYWLGTPYWGHGWMTQSLIALTGHAFATLGLRRLELLADTENARSRAVAERAGFTLVRTRRRLFDDRHEAVYERLAPS